MAVIIHWNIFLVSLLFVEIRADSGEFFMSSSRADKHPCEYDENKCQHGVCRQTEKFKVRNFLCACPPKRTGTLCEKTTPDCLKCKPEARTECTGFLDGTAVCICLEYTDGYTDAPSICYFQYKKKSDRQKACNRGDHDCTPGQECVNYAQNENKMAMVCQCPVGNTRGSDNCEEDYKTDLPGDVYSCIDTNMYGPICMCKKYGKNKNRYGFCKPQMVKPKLIAPLSDEGPCSFNNNKCRHGTCFLTDKTKFLCGCHSKYSGKYCHLKTPHCAECKTDQRVECLGLDDGTAVCICMEYFKPEQFSAPSLCYFPKARSWRQKACKAGDHKCDPGQQCVNYAYDETKMQMVCQCPVGRSRGKDCIEDYKFIDVADEQTNCLFSENYGPLCLCNEYGKNGNRPGFCKPNMNVHGAVVKPKGSGGPCDISKNRCRRGVCIETEVFKDWDFLCACPLFSTGGLCHYDMIECTQCKKPSRTDCIGLPDGTAVCICLEVQNKKDGKPPLICYYKKAKPHRQKACNAGDHSCEYGQECVNYAQSEDKMQMTCQCPAGKKRGRRCKEDYKLDLPAGRFPCVDTLLYGPICLCDKYSFRGNKYGFCIPQLKESSNYKLVKNAEHTLLKTESPCDVSHNICKQGVCMEANDGEDTTIVCSCPFRKTGRLCTQDMHECTMCQKSSRKDCIGLPDGTAVCVCVEFIKQNKAEKPAICYFLKAKTHRQKSCSRGDHECNYGQECVNYAQSEDKMQMTCQCPAGEKRGRNCNEDYLISHTTDLACIDTQKYGPICLCEEYGHGINKFGFCKPNLKNKGQVSATISKRNVPRNGDIIPIQKRSVFSRAYSREKPDVERNSEVFSTIRSGKCSFGTCGRGVCIETERGAGFACACLMEKTGQKCEKRSYPCSSCKKTARHDCIGLPDGTARCVCTEFIYRAIKEVPAICFYKKAKRHRQKLCKSGKHDCTSSQECVNYAQDENKMQMTCQCATGRYHGTNCQEEYKFVTSNDMKSCVQVEGQQPICICQKYGRKPGFCKLQALHSDSEIEKIKDSDSRKNYPGNTRVMETSRRQKREKPLSDRKTSNSFEIRRLARTASTVGDICAPKTCKHGSCDRFASGHVCSCPLKKTGDRCEKTSYPCSSCKTTARVDCIGLPDGTARCICTKFMYKGMNDVPTICYYKKAKKHRQKQCKSGKHTCSPKQKCVNYAQAKNKIQMTCQCGSGDSRGRNCEEDYKIVAPNGQTSCVKIKGQDPICLCQEYGSSLGFCKPGQSTKGFPKTTLKENSNTASNNATGSMPKKTIPVTTIKDTKTASNNAAGSFTKKILPTKPNNRKEPLSHRRTSISSKARKVAPKASKVGDPCSPKTCKHGSCDRFANGHVCSCPIKKTGDRCEKKSYPCSSCKETARVDCIGLPDGTARCICTKFMYKGMNDVPTICYYKKAKKHRQTLCKSGKHTCSPKQKCVNYAQAKNKMQMTCQCGSGDSRGRNCEEDYKIVAPNGQTSCVKIKGQDPICLCQEYGSSLGFCKPGQSTKDSNTASNNATGSMPKKTIPVTTIKDTKTASNNAAGSFTKKILPTRPNNRKEPLSHRRTSISSKARKVAPKASKVGDPCSPKTCKHGSCDRFANGHVCSCPIKKTGDRCEKKSYPCSSCKETARVDCIGLPDGTARCICTKFMYKGMNDVPTICYYKKAKKHRQKQCKSGKHTCSPKQKCVNYAQAKNKMQMTCQCGSGDSRGRNCEEDYKIVAPNGQTSCVKIKGQDPICLCQEYGSSLGFCKPGQSTKDSNTASNNATGSMPKKTIPVTTIKDTKTASNNAAGSFTKKILPTRPNNRKDSNTASNDATGSMPEKTIPVTTIKDPCSKKTCKHGSCDRFADGHVCSCPMKNTGDRCQKTSYPCSSCKKTARVDCIGLPDGTARCICTEFMYKGMNDVPTICYYKKAKKHRQKQCKSGKHTCSPKQKCVNYAQAKNKMQMTCQCGSGDSRGRNCEEDYKKVAPNGQTSCVKIKGQDPICLCQEYGSSLGFCKPGQSTKDSNTASNDATGSMPEKTIPVTTIKDPCSQKTCKHGSCDRFANGHVCSCPMKNTGDRCQKTSYPCSSCKKTARVDCIGLPDGTARCICTEFMYKGMNDVPTICYYKKAKKHRQKQCKSGKHTCSPKQKCVNYAQAENKIQMTCQCGSGDSRGRNCEEDYKKVAPNGQSSCVKIEGQDPICLCQEYGSSLGFCKPGQSTKDSKTASNDATGSMPEKTIPVTTIKDPCSQKTCKHGSCDRFANGHVCSCPMKNTGDRCQKTSYPCSSCKKTARVDCIGLPDGTARCICTEFMYKGMNDVPTICYYKKAKKHRQKQCKSGKHDCSSKQKCVNYAQAENKMQMTCQCGSGDSRGRNCEEDYKKVAPNGQTSCVKIEGQDPICLCQEYGSSLGFCKPGQSTKEQTDTHAVEKERKEEEPDVNTVGIDETPECTKCKKGAREDCIGLSDGFAFCICTNFMEKRFDSKPAICHFLKAKQHRQKACKAGDHTCELGQVCVNYAQSENKMQMTCQCPEGETRGKHCEEDYKLLTPNEDASCIKTIDNGYICLCYEYGTYGDGPGFCKLRHGKYDANVTPQDKVANSPSKNVQAPLDSNRSSNDDGTTDAKQKQQNMSSLLDPALKDDPCSSQPCLHDGLCRGHLSTPTQDFICICPLGRKGKICDITVPECDSLACTSKTDCISTPEGAVCICTVNYKDQLCSFKMMNVTEWEKVKLVITARTIEKIEIYAIVLLVLVGLTALYLVCHCIQVSSKRQEYVDKYVRVVKNGEVPAAPLPDWLDVSNDLAKQTFCCGTSKLPLSFNPKKKKKKEKKKKKKKKEKDENEVMKVRDKNENFSMSKWINRSHKQPTRNAVSYRPASCLEKDKVLHNKQTTKNKENDKKNKFHMRQDYVREYIKKHQKYFSYKNGSTNRVKAKYLQDAQSTKRMFRDGKGTDSGTKREFMDATHRRFAVKWADCKHPRCRSAQR